MIAIEYLWISIPTCLLTLLLVFGANYEIIRAQQITKYKFEIIDWILIVFLELSLFLLIHVVFAFFFNVHFN